MKTTGHKKELSGTVTSAKMDKTIVVKVSRRVKHKRYLKMVPSDKKYMVHDENNVAKEGDFVRIIEHRPYSKNKRWSLLPESK